MSHNSQKNQRSLSYFFYQAIQEKIPNGIELRKKCIEHTTERIAYLSKMQRIHRSRLSNLPNGTYRSELQQSIHVYTHYLRLLHFVKKLLVHGTCDDRKVNPTMLELTMALLISEYAAHVIKFINVARDLHQFRTNTPFVPGAMLLLPVQLPDYATYHLLQYMSCEGQFGHPTDCSTMCLVDPNRRAIIIPECEFWDPFTRTAWVHVLFVPPYGTMADEAINATHTMKLAARMLHNQTTEKNILLAIDVIPCENNTNTK